MMNKNCTIVTAYYKFSSKHPSENYDEWMKNFLTTIETPMVIFTDNKSVEQITELRKWNQNTKIIELPFEELYCSQFMEYWNKDLERDPEKRYHNQQLYIIWNEKSKFVERAIQENYFNTDYYCWCDIGCFRDTSTVNKYRFFPQTSKIKNNNTITLLHIDPYEMNEIISLKNTNINHINNIFIGKCRIGATIIIGHKDAWYRWISTFYTMMETFMKNDTFTGKDQDIMATIVALYPGLIELIIPPSRDWFYLQDYLS